MRLLHFAAAPHQAPLRRSIVELFRGSCSSAHIRPRWFPVTLVFPLQGFQGPRTGG